jgi:acylphosphatase
MTAGMSMRLMIEGRVQGVGYRAWAERQASRLRLDGWVRNRPDGSVELVAHGAAEALAALEQLCRRGPPAASVTSVTRSQNDDAITKGFSQRPTA